MHRTRFDTLLRALATAPSRRAALRVLGGLGLAGLFGQTAAKKRNAKKKCKKPCGPCKTCKKGKCKQAKPDGTVCGPDQVCSTGACLVPACGAGGPCRVFLSSILYDGDLDGLSGADAKCQGLAAAAGLPGTYKAWLSDTTSSPSSRFVPSSGPYRLVNGITIAANWADLTDGTLLAPINVTETGGGVGNTHYAWTHTLINGTAGGQSNVHCENWTTNALGFVDFGDMGSANASESFWWTRVGQDTCSTPHHLYCFQQS